MNIKHNPRCDHQTQTSTTQAGLKREVCETCRRVKVDFVGCSDPGVLFRIPRIA